MRCKLVRELILTDHTDGEMDPRGRAEVDEHIRSCAACRELKSAVTAQAVGPFRLAPKEDAPPYLWERIKAKIAAEDSLRAASRSFFPRFIRTVSGKVPGLSRPAIAFAMAAAIIIAVIMTRPYADMALLDAYLNEQVEFITKLDIHETNGSDIFDIEIRTGAENIL